MKTRLRAVLIGMIALVGLAAPARAQGPGVEVGVSGNPSQFYFGGQYEMSAVVDRVWFRPNVEIGVGHDRTLVGVNFEFTYRMPLPRSEWRLYFGGGPALNVTRIGGDTTSGGGFNLVLGASHEKGLFTQVKVGFMDSPAVRFGVGYSFD